MPITIGEVKPYSETVKIGKRSVTSNAFFVSKMFKRIRSGYSPIILICGQQRVGKSFVGVWLCDMYMRMMEKSFDPYTNTFYDAIDSLKRLETLTKESMMIDEAGEFINRKEWYQKTHIALNKMVQTQAYRSLLYVFVTPFASDIDRSFQKHFDFIIRVYDRGRFKVFQVRKRHDQFQEDKTSFRVFLDDIKLKKSAVDSDTWDRYEKFSFEQKEALRKLAIIQNDKKTDDFIEDPFMRLKKKMVA